MTATIFLTLYLPNFGIYSDEIIMTYLYLNVDVALTFNQ